MFHMVMDSFKCCIADDMLHFTGICGGGLLIDAQRYQQLGQKIVTTHDLLCGLKTGLGQGDVAVFVDDDVFAGFQKTIRPGNTGACISVGKPGCGTVRTLTALGR